MAKTITMMQFRASPGEFIHEVSHHNESFIITQNGKPKARLIPLSEDTTITSDGQIRGPIPVTHRRNLGA